MESGPGLTAPDGVVPFAGHQRNDTVVAEVEKEQAVHCGFVAGRTLRFLPL